MKKLNFGLEKCYLDSHLVVQQRIYIGHFYGAVKKLFFFLKKKVILFSQCIVVDVMSASVLLVDHTKSKFFLITSQSS